MWRSIVTMSVDFWVSLVICTVNKVNRMKAVLDRHQVTELKIPFKSKGPLDPVKKGGFSYQTMNKMNKLNQID